MAVPHETQNQPFSLEEATISMLHAAIKSGDITCEEIVQRYIDRVRAYNGVASQLVNRRRCPNSRIDGLRTRSKPTQISNRNDQSVRDLTRSRPLHGAAP